MKGTLCQTKQLYILAIPATQAHTEILKDNLKNIQAKEIVWICTLLQMNSKFESIINLRYDSLPL